MKRFHSPFRAIAASLLTAAISACATGGTSGALPRAIAPASLQPASAKPAASRHKLKIKLRIAIPKHARHRRLGHYVSPATQSITIAVTGSGPQQNFNADLTPATNPGCKASLISPLICTVTLSLAAGNYTATFATYDGLLQGGNGPNNQPTGNKLSGNQSVPLHIVSGSDNKINVTLDGVPTGVALVPDPTSTLSGSTSTGFTANKCGGSTLTTERVSVLGVDADDNYILGSGAPVPTLTSDNAVVAVATPSPESPNVFVLSHAISKNAQGPANLTATVTPLAGVGGTPAFAQIPVTIAGGTQICGLFTEYSLPHNSSPYAYGHLPVGINRRSG